MELRLMGTRQEVDGFVQVVKDNVPREFVRSISGWYPNRGHTIEGRVYIKLAIPTVGQDVIDNTLELKEWSL